MGSSGKDWVAAKNLFVTTIQPDARIPAAAAVSADLEQQEFTVFVGFADQLDGGVPVRVVHFAQKGLDLESML
jgi:hypothetical protein